MQEITKILIKFLTFACFKVRIFPTFSYFGTKIPTWSYFCELSYHYSTLIMSFIFWRCISIMNASMLNFVSKAPVDFWLMKWALFAWDTFGEIAEWEAVFDKYWKCKFWRYYDHLVASLNLKIESILDRRLQFVLHRHVAIFSLKMPWMPFLFKLIEGSLFTLPLQEIV